MRKVDHQHYVRSKAQAYGVLAVGAVREFQHCLRMAAFAQGFGNSRNAQQWMEDAEKEASSAVGCARMAAHYALEQQVQHYINPLPARDDH